MDSNDQLIQELKKPKVRDTTCKKKDEKERNIKVK